MIHITAAQVRCCFLLLKTKFRLHTIVRIMLKKTVAMETESNNYAECK